MWAKPRPRELVDRVTYWMAEMCTMCLTYSRMQRVTSTAVHMRNGEAHSRRLLREAMNEQDTYPGHLRHYSTLFFTLKSHYTGGEPECRESQPHAGPCCCLGSDKQTSRGRQPSERRGCGAISGRQAACSARPANHGWRWPASGWERLRVPGRLHPGPFFKPGDSWRLTSQA